MEINPDYIAIKHYLEGKLSPRESHELEKRALDDPFLADAIEGFRISKIPADSELSILQRRLEQHIASQQEKKSMLNFSWQRLSIAAAAGLLFITAGILFWMNQFQHTKKQADQGVEVSIADLSAQSDKYSQKLSERATVYFTDLTAEKTQPVSGWKAYADYLDKNVRETGFAKGDVVVGFQVNASGKTENFKIIKSLNPKQDAEAIRLINEGPSWIPLGLDKTSEIHISVKF